MSQERRKTNRFRTELPATVWLGAEPRSAVVTNASHSGMFLETETSLPLMRLLQIELVLPNERSPIRVSAMAVYQSHDRNAGVGVRFVCLDASAEESWARFVGDLKRHGHAPADEPAPRPKPEPRSGSVGSVGSRPRRIVRSASPELRVTIKDPVELRELASDIIAGRELMIETAMRIPLTSKVWVTLVSPSTRRAVSLSAHVRGVYAEAELSGVAVSVMLEDGERKALAEFANAPINAPNKSSQKWGFDQVSETMRVPSFEGLFD